MTFTYTHFMTGVIAAALTCISFEAAAQESKSDIKKAAKRAAQCEAIFHRLKFRKLALSEDTTQKKAVDENWKFWSTRALDLVPSDKARKYQKKARKAVIQNGATNAVVAGCSKERSTILVDQLQKTLLSGTGLSDEFAEAARLQRIENAKPENVVFCKHMADRLLSYHTKEAAGFDKEPSNLIVADAKTANDAYDALSSKQKADLEEAAKLKVDETYSNGGLKQAADMCMPGFFIKSSRVVSPIDAANKRRAEREAANQ